MVSPDGLWTEANLQQSCLSLAPCGSEETVVASRYFSTAMEKWLSCSDSQHCCSQDNLPTRAGSHGGLVSPACPHRGDSPNPFNAHFELHKLRVKGFSLDANGDKEKTQEERIAGRMESLGWLGLESIWNVQKDLPCLQPHQAEGCLFWGGGDGAMVHISLSVLL